MRFSIVVLATTIIGFSCGRPPHAPAEHSKIAVVECSVAPNAKIEDYGGDAASLGMSIAQAIAEEIRDDDTLDAQAIPKTVPADGDLIVRGEITHLDGGNLAVRMTVLVCYFCGWWAGDAVVGVQGQVTRRDGTVVGVFSDEKISGGITDVLGWTAFRGEGSAVHRATGRIGEAVGEMVKEGEYRGGHPGNDGYLEAVAVAEHSADRLPSGRPPADRLRALDELRAQGLISDAEYAEKRKEILQEF